VNLAAALQVLRGESTLPPPPAVPSFESLDALDAWNREQNGAYLVAELHKRDAEIIALKSSVRLARGLLAKGHTVSAAVVLERVIGPR
jgi:hypothetical protein